MGCKYREISEETVFSLLLPISDSEDAPISAPQK